MAELIERLEAADGPCRELEYRIAYALGWRFDGFEGEDQSRDQETLSDQDFADLGMMAGAWKLPHQDRWPTDFDPPRWNDCPPEWTSSIDAALTLAEGFSEAQLWMLWNDALTACSCADGDLVKDLPRFIVIAALKAMEANPTTGDEL